MAKRLNKSKASSESKKNSFWEKAKRVYHGLAALVGIFGGLFFLLPNITGNVIVDSTVKTISFLGASLFVLGLIAGVFWLKGSK